MDSNQESQGTYRLWDPAEVPIGDVVINKRNERLMITGCNDNIVYLGDGRWVFMQSLFDNWTLEGGHRCGAPVS